MIRSYIITALRIIKRQKFFVLLNILGLSIGMASFILIMLWVNDEVSYEGFHKNKDQLYRILTFEESATRSTYFSNNPLPLGPELMNRYPEIINYCRFDIDRSRVKYNNKLFAENHFCYSDSSLFSMFTFTFLSGNPKTLFQDKESIAISENIAKKYFNEKDPIGKILEVDGENTYVIRAIFKDVPSNSNIRFDFVAPI